MDKLLVERPRARCGRFFRYPRGKLKNRFRDEGARMEGLGRAYRDKHFNENLRPLVRFLRSNVGRPWNKIHSEMSQFLKPSSTVQRHVFVHLWQLVARDVVVAADGTLWAHDAWHGPGPLDRGYYSTRWPRFYVCPKAGLLREWKPPKK